MTVYATRPHTDAVLAALVAAADPHPVGDGRARTDLGVNLEPPYAVLYAIGSPEFSGSLTESQRQAFPLYQVTFVGEHRKEVEHLRDRVRADLHEQVLTVAGRVTSRLWLDLERPVTRDEDTPGGLLYAIDQYRMTTVPDDDEES